MRSMALSLVLLLMGCLLAGAWPALAQPAGPLPPEAEQVLFVVDDSASMSAPAGDPDDPLASRWQMVQKAYPIWLERLGPEVLVGGVSLGGTCSAAPAMRLPVGTERQQLAAAIATTRPNGWTNLNTVPQSAPGLFASAVRGSKRIVLLSDGLNTCPPTGPTCDIARQLHRDHGIIH